MKLFKFTKDEDGAVTVDWVVLTSGLSAVKQGDNDIGRGLLQDAIDTHPRHFEEAVRSLESLNRTVKS